MKYRKQRGSKVINEVNEYVERSEEGIQSRGGEIIFFLTPDLDEATDEPIPIRDHPTYRESCNADFAAFCLVVFFL